DVEPVDPSVARPDRGPVLGDLAGIGGRLRLPRVPARLSGAAAGRALPGPDDLRAGRRDTAAAEIRPARRLDRGRAGTDDPQTGPTRRPAAVRRPVAVSVHARRGGSAV